MTSLAETPRFIVRAIRVEATRALRQRILRPTQRAEDLVLPRDDAPETRHFGAFARVGQTDVQPLVGVASVYREGRSGETDTSAWRLRGMATSEEVRRQGCGAALLRACLAYAEERGGTSMWCNARVSASAFYAAQGFEREGEAFDLPDIGPHYVMSRAIAARGE